MPLESLHGTRNFRFPFHFTATLRLHCERVENFSTHKLNMSKVHTHLHVAGKIFACSTFKSSQFNYQIAKKLFRSRLTVCLNPWSESVRSKPSANFSEPLHVSAELKLKGKFIHNPGVINGPMQVRRSAQTRVRWWWCWGCTWWVVRCAKRARFVYVCWYEDPRLIPSSDNKRN